MSHEHRWKLALHLDGCHFYQSSYGCECGAALHTLDERDPEGDPYSVVWMEPTSDDVCNRCVELLGGAEPQHHHEVVEAGSRR